MYNIVNFSVFMEPNINNAACVIVVILASIKDNEIKGCSITSIVELFIAGNCPNLIGKPKVIMILDANNQCETVSFNCLPFKNKNEKGK